MPVCSSESLSRAARENQRTESRGRKGTWGQERNNCPLPEFADKLDFLALLEPLLFEISDADRRRILVNVYAIPNNLRIGVGKNEPVLDLRKLMSRLNIEGL